jgi:hypothetical protein
MPRSSLRPAAAAGIGRREQSSGRKVVGIAARALSVYAATYLQFVLLSIGTALYAAGMSSVRAAR